MWRLAVEAGRSIGQKGGGRLGLKKKRLVQVEAKNGGVGWSAGERGDLKLAKD